MEAKLQVAHFDQSRVAKLRPWVVEIVRIMELERIPLTVSHVNASDLHSVERGIVAGVTRTVGGRYETLINAELHWLEQLFSMCHELVHVRQMVDGRLCVDDHGITWEGVWVPFDPPMLYGQRGWEVEAHLQEIQIARSVLEVMDEDIIDRINFEALQRQRSEMFGIIVERV